MFEQKERLIFSYESEGRTVLADPVELDRRINHYLPIAVSDVLRNWNMAVDKDHPRPDLMPTEDAIFEAQEQLLVAVRQAFRMKSFDPQTGLGALEDECLEAWDKFQRFLDEKKSLEGSWRKPSSFGDGITPPPVEPEPTMAPMSPSC